MFGLVTGLLLPLMFGGKIILMEKHRPKEALDLIEKEKVTVHNGVPTMFFREIEEYRKNKKDISTLRTGIAAGAAVPKSLIKMLHTELQFIPMVAYGLTETLALTCTNLDDSLSKISETVGKPIDEIELKVIDDKGNHLGKGQVGEIICRGSSVMKGYCGMPEETKKTIDENGWLHTGDLGIIDEQGYIRFVGRIKDLIIRGGNNISPVEVENLYFQHPEVLEICILGVPSKELGEKTYAFVKLHENYSATTESLGAYAEGKIAKYKIPDQFIFVKKMPKLKNGKIDKQRLREYFQQKKELAHI
jgi:fatty-acyl-CoA synthase/long-chain acyl-CoA synthetase